MASQGLPVLTAAEVARALRRDGWSISRRGRRHDIYGHSVKSGIVPLSRQRTEMIKPKT